MSEDNDNKVFIKPPWIIEGSELDKKITEKLMKKSPVVKTPEKDTGQPMYHRHYRRPLAYVSNYVSNSVSLVEIRTGLKVMDIPVGYNPTGIDISPDQEFVYVANSYYATLSVISSRNNRVVNTINLNAPPFSAAYSSGVKFSFDGRFIYVANSVSHNISVVNDYLQQVVTEVPLPAGADPSELEITADGKLAYVTGCSANNVIVVDLAVNLPVKYIAVGNTPYGIAIDRRNSLALVAINGSDILNVINTVIAEASPNTIAVGSNPLDVIFSFQGNIAYVSNWADNNVGIVDVFSHQQIANIPVGSYPTFLALTANGRYLVVSNIIDNTVSIIDTRINKVTATVPVGFGPMNIAILN